MMRNMLVAVVAAAVIAQGAQAKPHGEEAVRKVVAAVLDDSAAGWNGGDLDRFMTCYAKEATTTYVSGGKLFLGFDAIRGNYATRFAAGRPGMGTLTLSILNLRLVDPDHAYVVGRFVLRRGPGRDIEGLTTLLFQRSGTTWRIIADHS